MSPIDVVVVGAGPTGLLLSGDLAAAGVRCVVIERRAGELNLSRAFVVHARTLEQLDVRGVADELISTGSRIDEVRFFGAVSLGLTRLPSRFNHLLFTPQYETERVLRKYAEDRGVEFRDGVEAVGLRQDPEGVEVNVRTGDGGTDTVRAAYLVGADGVRSMVREALGLPFPGHSVIRSVMLADVRLTDEPPQVVTVDSVGDAFAFLTAFGDGWYRITAWSRRHQMPNDVPVDLDELREVLKRAFGTDHGMYDTRWTSRFHSDERQVPRYRTGRVFLAGDAAHVHSPAGGQGMNAGMQDAANLGWKLASVIHGRADEGLLDTYHAERHPVGEQVLRRSGVLLRALMATPYPVRVARRTLLHAATRFGPVARRMSLAMSGIGIAYPAPADAHPLAGRRAPDVPLTDGRRLYEALRGGCFALVTPAGDLPAEAVRGRAQLVFPAGPTRKTVLVRPDAYIAWATEEPDPGHRASLVSAALDEWCGPAHSSAHP